MKTRKKDYPPRRHRTNNVHSLFLILFIIIGVCIVLMMHGCRTPNGCRATRNMSGYGLNQSTSTKVMKLIDKYHGTWVKCNETGIVCVSGR